MQSFVTGKMPKGYFDFAKDPNYAGNRPPRKGAYQQMVAMKKAAAAKAKPAKKAAPKPTAKKAPSKAAASDQKFQAARKQYYNIKK